MAKKKRTAKQIAAFKKMRVGLAKYRKKNPSKVKRKVVKRKAVRLKVKRKAVKRKVIRKSNPIKKQYYIKQASKYFDGGGFSVSKTNTAYFTSEQHAVKIANALAKLTGKPISLRVTGHKKKR